MLTKTDPRVLVTLAANATETPPTVALSGTEPPVDVRKLVTNVPSVPVVPEAGVNVEPAAAVERLTVAEGVGLSYTSRNVNVMVVATFTRNDDGVNKECVGEAAPALTANALLVAVYDPLVAVIWKLEPAFVSETPLNVARPPVAFTVVDPAIVAPPVTESDTASLDVVTRTPVADTNSTLTEKDCPAMELPGCVAKRMNDTVGALGVVGETAMPPPPPHERNTALKRIAAMRAPRFNLGLVNIVIAHDGGMGSN